MTRIGGSAVAELVVAAREARANAKNLVWAQRLAIGLIVVGALDAFSTEVALAAGSAWEMNPLIRAAQATLGVYWVMPKMLLHGFLAGMVVWYPNRATLIAMTGVSLIVLLASINNFTVYLNTSGAL